MGLMSPLVLLTTENNTNIFNAPEARKEAAPEIKVIEDVPEEPEMPPIEGTCHL